MKYRSRTDIVVKMLSYLVQQPRGVTDLMMESRLSWPLVKEYLDVLIANGLVVRKPQRQFGITSRGTACLNKLVEVQGYGI